MDRSTLSNYGWIIVTTIIIALMIVLATPFGNYIGDAFTSITEDFTAKVEEVDDVEDVENITIYDGKETVSFEMTPEYQAPEEAGAQGNGAILIPGPEGAMEAMVAGILHEGDQVIYGDYVYTYTNASGIISAGWMVSLRDNDRSKGSYYAVANKILGAPVVSLNHTFESCYYLTEAPVLPDNAEDLTGTFFDCPSLITVAKLPDNAKLLNGTFEDCISLTGDIAVGGNMHECVDTFKNTIQPINVLGLSGPSQAAEIAIIAIESGCSNITYSYMF